MINNYNNRSLYMRSRQQKTIQKSERTTACDEQKRCMLFKRLTLQSIEQFRGISINDFDLNITQHIQELQEIDSTVTPLIYAAFYGLKDIMKVLLNNKFVDVDLQTENNKQTPLITACLNGNYEIVRLLLLAQAEVNKPNLMNQIPLTATLFRLVQEPTSFENKKICFLIADLLIKNGADLNWIIDKKKGYSMLHYLCSQKMKMNKIQKTLNYEIIKFLLEKGANYKMTTLIDRSCIELLQHHCDRDQLERLFNIYLQQQVIKRVETHTIKKIDPNYFRIDAQT